MNDYVRHNFLIDIAFDSLNIREGEHEAGSGVDQLTYEYIMGFGIMSHIMTTKMKEQKSFIIAF